ncbi:hypothetical protein P5673_011016 [Acropora cervicornis]|uniref:UPAR/Ly6 domain-containing protein n=1 Tax=Acropora cervicornis TaxID=6130 RepID=A0AAD9QPL6_ACRCE|nr:hypothetical protein P5673_011016 [Acropora cervicornis]
MRSFAIRIGCLFFVAFGPLGPILGQDKGKDKCCGGNSGLLFIDAQAMQCYYCASSSSWDDCKTQEITCESSDDARCAKVYIKTKIRKDTYASYTKSCLRETLCKSAKTARCKGTEDCKVNCCSGDLCNTASTKVVSAVFLVLCAFLASVMIQ